MTTCDYADRPATLLARHAGQPDQPLVTAASYLPAGPLSSLTLDNGLTETRGNVLDNGTLPISYGDDENQMLWE